MGWGPFMDLSKAFDGAPKKLLLTKLKEKKKDEIWVECGKKRGWRVREIFFIEIYKTVNYVSASFTVYIFIYQKVTKVTLVSDIVALIPGAVLGFASNPENNRKRSNSS